MSGFVYFIAPEAALHRGDHEAVVKIGFTRNNPYVRLRALQIGSPVPLVLWAYIEGTEALEKAFHEAFAELRSHGEWFYIMFKMEEFLRYLGEEPNIGNLINHEQLSVALFDTVFSKCLPHPSIPEEAWLRSADARPLAKFYPEIWEELNA